MIKNKYSNKVEAKIKKDINKRFNDDDFPNLLCEIIVQGDISENQRLVLERVLLLGYQYHDLTKEGLKIFNELISQYIVLNCSECCNEMGWVEMFSASKRAYRCYSCFAKIGNAEQPPVTWEEK